MVHQSQAPIYWVRFFRSSCFLRCFDPYTSFCSLDFPCWSSKVSMGALTIWSISIPPSEIWTRISPVLWMNCRPSIQLSSPCSAWTPGWPWIHFFTVEQDIDDVLSTLAGSSQGDCSFSTSLLPDGLKKSREVTKCHNPDSSSGEIDIISGGDDDIVPGSNDGGAALEVNPKVAPYLNIESMELNEICPPQSLVNNYYIPVCSSPNKRDTSKRRRFPYYWQLQEAQLSKCKFFTNPAPRVFSLSIRLEKPKHTWLISFFSYSIF